MPAYHNAACCSRLRGMKAKPEPDEIVCKPLDAVRFG